MFDNISRKKKENESEPPQSSAKSPHFQNNLDYYNVMLKKVLFEKEVKLEMQRHQSQITCVLFVYGHAPEPAIDIFEGNIGARKGAYVLSFHQNHSSFRRELCDIFNELGYKGLLSRRLVDIDDKWGER